MKHFGRLFGFTLGYLGVKLLERVVLNVERQSVAYARAEELEAAKLAPRQRCLCSRCQASRDAIHRSSQVAAS